MRQRGASSQGSLLLLSPDAGWSEKAVRQIRLAILISEYNPQSQRFFENLTTIRRLRRKQIESGSTIIHSFSLLRLYYDIWMGVMFISCLVVAPVEVAFRGMRTIHLFGAFLDVACFCDIILRFRTSYIDEKERRVIMDSKKIAKKYIVSVFLMSDVLSSLPDPILFTHEENFYNFLVSLLGLLKVFRVITTHQTVINTAQNFQIDSPSFRIAVAGLFFILAFHWTCCGIFILPQFRVLLAGTLPENSWIKQHKFNEKTVNERYMYALYRATGLIFGIKWRISDYLSWEEKVAAWWAYLAGKILMGYVTVVAVAKFLDLWSLRSKYYQKTYELEYFVTRHHLKDATRSRLFQFYDYKFQKLYFEENKIKEFLPEHLRRQVMAEILTKFASNITIFADLPQDTINKIIWNLQSEVFLPQDIIIKAGTVGDYMYFLYSGTVAVLSPAGKEVGHLQDGDYFGEISLLIKDIKRTAHVVAVEICEVLKLSKKGFNSCLRNENEVIEKMLGTANERMKITQVYEDIYTRNYMEEGV